MMGGGMGGRSKYGSPNPKVEEELKRPRRGILLRLGKYLWQMKWFLLLALGLTIGGNTFSLLGPTLSGKAIDCIGTQAGGVDFAGVRHYALLMVLFYLVSAIMSYFLSVTMVYVSRRVTLRMRSDLFNHIADMPVGFFDTHPVGDVISRIFYDIDTINTSLSTDVVSILASFITIFGSLMMMLRLSSMLVLVFVITIPLSILITRFITTRTNPLFRLRSRKMGELNDFVEEKISGMKTLKAYHQEGSVTGQLDALNSEVVQAYYKSEYYSSITGPSVSFVNNLSLSLISVFGGLLYMSGGVQIGGLAIAGMTIGGISSFIMYSRKFAGPINEIANIFGELQSALAAADRVFSLLDAPLESADAPDAVTLADVRGDVEMKDVSFGYEPGRLILKHLNLRARSGNLIAIVGPTGAGKTTLINLLMRFYDVNGGAIRVDGTDVRQITRASLRANYGMVLQETWLKSGTIRENLVMGKPDATDEEVIAAARACHAHSFIKRLPQGYDTVIGEDGGRLSQGQKQLLCITRIMLCLPPMLILDEATSSIDTRTELKIQHAFTTMMDGRTTFIVAHRLSTIREADVILVMRDGSIVEMGSHEALLQRNGFYAKLYNSQFAA